MQVITCQIGEARWLGDNTRALIHGRQRGQVVLGASAPACGALIFRSA
jgi:hypothetical protein